MTVTANVADRVIGDASAEAALLGGVLIAAEAGVGRAAEVLGDVAPEDLVDPRHAMIAAACHSLLDYEVSPIPLAVLAELRRTGAASRFVADRSAGTFVADLVAACPAVPMADYSRRLIAEAAARRRAVQAGERIKQAAEGAGDLADLCALLDREAAAVHEATGRVRSWPRTSGASRPTTPRAARSCSTR